MQHVVFIGGGTGGGKSTLARGLAERHGLRVYRIDDRWYAHDEILAEPRRTPEEQWLDTPPERQAEEFHETSARRFALVLAELQSLPAVPAIVVEGPQVLPELLPPAARVVFLAATRAFQERVLAERPMPPTRDPDRALRNRIEKDRLFGERVALAARSRGLPVLEVDGSRSPEAILDEVSESFGLGPPPTGVDFDAIRRWEQEAYDANVRAWLASGDVG